MICPLLRSAEHERGILWDDPAIGIEWPVLAKDDLLSDKEKSWASGSGPPISTTRSVLWDKRLSCNALAAVVRYGWGWIVTKHTRL